MSRHSDPAQMDLFAWADARPSAKVLDAIPCIAKRMWRERLEPIAHREGRLVTFPPALAAPVTRRAGGAA